MAHMMDPSLRNDPVHAIPISIARHSGEDFETTGGSGQTDGRDARHAAAKRARRQCPWIILGCGICFAL